MKKRRLISLLCVLCLLTACAGKSGTPKLFFLWTQGYLAAPCGEEGMVALTLYAKKLSSPFDLSAPGVIRLDGISPEDIRITCDLSAADVDSGQGYQAYSLILTYTPLRAGVYVSESVTFVLDDQTQFTYPFGRFVFEVGEEDTQIADTWSSPAASSNAAEFAYQYMLNSGEARLTELKIGENAVLTDPDGLALAGKIPLGEFYSAPLVYIRSKLCVEQGGASAISYGKGCYCGGFNATESLFDRSLRHWTQDGET